MNREFSDVLTMRIVFMAVAVLFYRFIWKKKGNCHGCSSSSCPMARRKE